MTKPTLEDWNWITVMLTQALWGAISNNVRAITLTYTTDAWLITAYLIKNDDADAEEIFDVADELSIYIEDIKSRLSIAADQKITGITKSTKENFTEMNDEMNRLIFLRKEADSGHEFTQE